MTDLYKQVLAQDPDKSERDIEAKMTASEDLWTFGENLYLREA